MASSDFVDLLQTVEKAAEIVQAAGQNKISDAERLQAEDYLLQLRQLRSPYSLCQYALESTSTSTFVRYQIVYIFQEAILREWVSLDSEAIESYWKYLLDYTCKHQELPYFIISELLITVSMIVKRGTFDGKSGETDKIYETVSTMIFSNDANMVSFACQILYNLCTEYYTTWRSSAVGLSWDFHVRAKRHFENTDLKKVFQLSLHVLHNLVSSSLSQTLISNNMQQQQQQQSAAEEILISKFLNLACCVLNWNFGSKYLPKRLTYSVEFSPAFSLHPPDTWRDLFLNNDVLQFFFTLHDKVRLSSSLCHNSLQCLIQLASLCGSIFPDDSVREKYLTFFVSNFVRLFQSSPSAEEAVNFAEIAQKLLTYHGPSAFKRLNAEILEQFYVLVTQVTCEFCCKATEESMKEMDTRTYQEAYSKLLEGWCVLIKAEESESAMAVKVPTVYTTAIFDAFWRCHVSGPIGTRSETIHENDNEVEIDENFEDDKEDFVEVLHNVAIFGRHCFEQNVNTLANILIETMNRYANLIENVLSNETSSSASTLKALFEDLHWILLLTGNVLTMADVDVVFYIPLPVFSYYSKRGAENSAEIDMNSTQLYLFHCLQSPERESPLNVDVVSKLIGCVFRWAAFEQKILMNKKQFCILSPQVAETTMWCLKRLISAYGDSDERYAAASSNCQSRNALQAGTELSIYLTEFVLEKFFAILLYWSNEEHLSKEAALMLVNFIETGRAEEILKHGNFLEKVKKISLPQLCPAARKNLLKSMVKICSTCDTAAQSSQSCQALNEIILIPLQKRYESVLKLAEGAPRTQHNENLAELLDLLDCFCGVVQGAADNNYKWLFAYILPVLQSCVSLSSMYKSNQAAVDAVLQLYVDVTRKFSVHLSDQIDKDSFYRCILTMLSSYAANNVEKYKTTVAAMNNMGEDKVSDLLLFLQMLIHLLSKYLFVATSTDSPDNALNVSIVILTGLEIIIPIMNANFLRYPQVCSKFYALITSLAQLHAEKLFQFGDNRAEMRRNLLKAAKIGLSFDYGVEIVKSSLELLQALATYVCQHSENLAALETRVDLGCFIKPVFEMCLRASCEVDVLHDASTTLFSLYTCNEDAFRSFVSALIASHENSTTREKLTAAFAELLPSVQSSSALSSVPGQKYGQLRKQKLTFRDKFEKFLDNVQGLLHIV